MDVVTNADFLKCRKVFVVKSHDKGEVLHEGFDFLLRLSGLCWKIYLSEHFFHVIKQLFVVGMFFDQLVYRQRYVADPVSLT